MLAYGEIEAFLAGCLRCGNCKAGGDLASASCPAGEYFGFEGFFSSGKIWMARGLQEGALEWNDPDLLRILYACTLCGACTRQCPLEAGGLLMEVFEVLRAEAVRRLGTPFAAHRRLRESVVQYRNPWRQPRRRRSQWAEDVPVKILGPGRAEVLYFVGCTAALDPALQHIARNTAALMKRAEVDFGILGEEEVCCGSVLLRTGERDLAEELARKNLDLFEKTGASTIVTSCAGCYKTLSRDYQAFGGVPARVVHSSQYLWELMESGRLVPQRALGLEVTYHDPCHLGRHCGVYDAPRELLRALPGITVREMARHREDAWCCGAGGGVRSAFPEWALWSSRLRVEEAGRTGAEVLATACPFCLQNLRTGAQAAGESMELMDLTDLLARLLL